jgi:hypothetical protein
MGDQDALVEELAVQANRDLQAGREAAEEVREDAEDAIKFYTAGDGTPEVEAAKAIAIATQASVATQEIEATSNAKVAELSAGHRAAMAKVDELHLALGQSGDRTRQIRQRTPIRTAITEVQIRAANQSGTEVLVTGARSAPARRGPQHRVRTQASPPAGVGRAGESRETQSTAACHVGTQGVGGSAAGPLAAVGTPRRERFACGENRGYAQIAHKYHGLDAQAH